MKNLVSKPYTKGTAESFRTHALDAHTRVMKGTYTESWTNMVAEHNTFYQDLVQSKDYPPALGGRSDQDSAIQGLIAKTVDQKLSKLNLGGNGSSGGGGNNQSGGGNNKKRACCECGSTDHLVKDCPKKNKDKKDDGNGNKDKDWRHVPPNSGKGEAKEKTVDGKLYKWCGKCRGNKGLWTTGKYLHSAAEHRPKKKEGEDDKNDGGEGNLAFLDEPLEFGFFAQECVNNHMKAHEWCCEIARHVKPCNLPCCQSKGCGGNC